MNHEPFSLVGGPLDRLVLRTGRVRATHPAVFGLMLGAALWTGLMALAALEGVAGNLFSLSRISGHLRLLVVIPLLFYAEFLIDPRVSAFVDILLRTGVVPAESRPAFDALARRVSRLKQSWQVDAVCLLIALLVSVNARYLPIPGATAAVGPGQVLGLAAAPLTSWFWFGCLILFRFLMVRWMWRIGLWTYTLRRISRLKLHLVPTHPDGVGGLGYLEVVQTHFGPIVLAISTLQSSAIAEELASGLTTFDAIAPAVVSVLAVDAVLIVGPLLFFVGPLYACKVKGLRDYMELGAEYVTEFERKWVGTATTRTEPLLGTADLQSLADLNNSMSVVRTMWVIPASSTMFIGLAITAVVPILPLLLFKYPLAELASTFFSRLTGL